MSVWLALAPLADKTPKENDVVAGWTGFAVFVGLCVATALLLWSFSRQLRRTRESFGVDRAGRPLEPGPGEREEPEDAAGQKPQVKS